MQVAERSQGLGQVVNALQGAHCAITGIPALFRVLRFREGLMIHPNACIPALCRLHTWLCRSLDPSPAFFESNVISSSSCSTASQNNCSVAISMLLPSLHVCHRGSEQARRLAQKQQANGDAIRQHEWQLQCTLKCVQGILGLARIQVPRPACMWM